MRCHLLDVAYILIQSHKVAAKVFRKRDLLSVLPSPVVKNPFASISCTSSNSSRRVIKKNIQRVCSGTPPEYGGVVVERRKERRSLS